MGRLRHLLYFLKSHLGSSVACFTSSSKHETKKQVSLSKFLLLPGDGMLPKPMATGFRSAKNSTSSGGATKLLGR